MIQKKINLFLIAFLFFAQSVLGDYTARDDVKEFIEFMHDKYDFDKTYLLEIFGGATHQEKVIRIMNRPVSYTHLRAHET